MDALSDYLGEPLHDRRSHVQQPLVTGPSSHCEESPSQGVPPVVVTFHQAEVDQRLELSGDDRLVAARRSCQIGDGETIARLRG